jgi:hypothetical protein
VVDARSVALEFNMASSWRPQTTVAYVTFMVDPDIDTNRTSNAGDVWLIAVTRDVPQERLEHGRTEIGVTPWPKRLQEIVQAAAALRPTP